MPIVRSLGMVFCLVTGAAYAQSSTAVEAKAEAVWQLRAALNVAALQCQYDPALKVVDNYNQFSRLHKTELNSARMTMENQHRRRYGKAWANQFDRYNTRTYNGFSATGIQVSFCNKMGDVGSKSVALAPEALPIFAQATVPEIRALYPQPVPVPKVVAKKPVKAAVKKKKKSSSKKKRT